MYGAFNVVVIFISWLWSSVKGPSASAKGSLGPGLSVCLTLSLSCPAPVLPLAIPALVALCPSWGTQEAALVCSRVMGSHSPFY